ncbi:hypothetical protein Tcan_12075 [Toxocara canis]|uniref:Uncharacterized protein n=1 Tax=Toxocara canis TaxID=6265 RepID=A0A0B2UNR4_TOXCA|nr:hypothetical protein Tcan_12075 [Toxocara canis]
MKRKNVEEATNSAENVDVCEATPSTKIVRSSFDAGNSENSTAATREEGAAKRKRGRPRKTETTSTPSTSTILDEISAENGKTLPDTVDKRPRSINWPVLPGLVSEQNVGKHDEQSIVQSIRARVVPEQQESNTELEDDEEEVTIVHDSSQARSNQKERSVIVQPSSSLRPMNLRSNNDSVVIAEEGSFEDFTQMTRFRTAQIIVRGRTLFVNPYALIEYSDVMANVVEKSGRNCKIQLDFMNFDDLQTALRIFCRSPVTGLKERLNDPNNAIAKKKCQALRSCSVFIGVLKDVVECDDIPDTSTGLGVVIAEEGSFEDFTQMTRFRTAQIIVRGRTLFVNPYALIEYSDVMANVVEKSGRNCKIQLDFMNFDDLQTALRIFCRSPVTGLKERLNDPNNAIAKKKCQALRSCSVFIGVLKDVVECDDIPDTSTGLGSKESEAIAEWYVPSKYRTFELIPADTQAVFVNMEMIKEYSSVLADSPAIFSDYCMLPQFTSSELITALNVLFRNSHTGRFHSVTLENMETLYKCASLFECLRPMCDAFSKDVSLDAVIKADWYRLKSILQVQASRRKCGEPNRLLLADILSTTAGLLRDTAHVLERLQRAGLADIPMGIGTALMVAVTEARARCDESEAMRLIL